MSRQGNLATALKRVRQKRLFVCRHQGAQTPCGTNFAVGGYPRRTREIVFNWAFDPLFESRGGGPLPHRGPERKPLPFQYVCTSYVQAHFDDLEGTSKIAWLRRQLLSIRETKHYGVIWLQTNKIGGIARIIYWLIAADIDCPIVKTAIAKYRCQIIGVLKKIKNNAALNANVFHRPNTFISNGEWQNIR